MSRQICGHHIIIVRSDERNQSIDKQRNKTEICKYDARTIKNYMRISGNVLLVIVFIHILMFFFPLFFFVPLQLSTLQKELKNYIVRLNALPNAINISDISIWFIHNKTFEFLPRINVSIAGVSSNFNNFSFSLFLMCYCCCCKRFKRRHLTSIKIVIMHVSYVGCILYI